MTNSNISGRSPSRFNRFHTPTASSNVSNSVFGSTRAAKFLRDVVEGTDSVDIVTIGDSNAGSAGSGGYQAGLATACAISGMPIYATPIGSTAHASEGNQRTGGMFLPLNNFVWQSTQSAPLTTLTNAAGVGDPQAGALKNALGFDTSELSKPYGFTWDGAFVSHLNVYTSAANGARIRVLRPSTMTEGTGVGGTLCQYRLVHGIFNAGSGLFRLLVMKDTNTIVEQGSFVFTNLGATGYATSFLDFTSPTVSSAPVAFTCAYDGYGTTNNEIRGPFCALWHSVIEKRKGFCVSNFNYEGGATMLVLEDRMYYMGHLLTSYLKELRERQIAAGGSGRVIIWLNGGVNSPPSSGSWLASVAGIRSIINTKWLNVLGYPWDDIAFVFSATHPQAPGTTETSLQNIRTSANTWAAAGAGISSVADSTTCVVDISKLFTYQQLSSLRLYQSFNNSEWTPHLSETVDAPTLSTVGRYANTSSGNQNYYDIRILNDGYATVSNAVVKALLDHV